MTSSLSVAICVATLHRPVGLRRLLESLAHLDTSGLDIHLVVVDNDAAGSAREVVDSFRGNCSWPLTYLVQPERGLSPARNMLVKEVRKLGVEYFAMIDDDETADLMWLRNLVNYARANRTDVLGGRAVHIFPPGTPESIRICFKYAEAPGPGEIRRLSGANLLIRVSALEYLPEPFNMALGTTGSDDSEFTERLFRDGRKLAFINDAITYEHVPESRTRSRWILKRAYRVGMTNAHVVRLVHPSFGKSTGLVVTSLGRIVAGSGQVLYSAIFRRDLVLFRARRVASGIGSIATLISPRAEYHEYDTVHGT